MTDDLVAYQCGKRTCWTGTALAAALEAHLNSMPANTIRVDGRPTSGPRRAADRAGNIRAAVSATIHAPLVQRTSSPTAGIN